MSSQEEKKEENAQDEGAQAPSARTPVEKHTAQTVYLGKDIEIFCSKEIPKYSNGPVKAYEACGQGNKPKNLFAIVCERHLTPRLDAISSYANILNNAMATLVGKGKVHWPPAGQERYVLVYNDNLGNPLMSAKDEPALGWRQEEVMAAIIPPIVSVLQDFRDKDFVHGAIRPSNMFDGGKKAKESVVLGECLSSPASYAQPALYEPIERAMASPLGRGKGTQADDLYAFGVSVAVIMRNNDPMEGFDTKAVIKQKIEHGSYAAITGKDRFTGSILELLRGLLHDDPSQRWTVDEMLAWLDGRRLSPKQALKHYKAARPIAFGGKKYLRMPLLAMDLEKNQSEAVSLIEEGGLMQWLERSMEDEVAAERLENAIRASMESGRGAGYHDRLISNVSIALDPNAPIRFKGLSFTGDGAGTVLAKAMVLKEDLRPINDVFQYGIALNWAASQENPFIDAGSLISRFDACRGFLKQNNKVGYGLERCLYYLNPSCHCLSEKLSGYFVLTPEDMMYAFEDLCRKGKAPALFLDRHSIAFLAVKERKSVESYFYDLGSKEEYRRVLGNLKALATIQKLSSMPPFKGIAKTLSEMLPQVYVRYHDKSVREKLEKNIKRFAESGDLVKMAGLLDNPEVIEKDNLAFRKAMGEFLSLSKEYQNLERGLSSKETFGKKTGQDVSAVFSCLVAGFIILVVTFLSITGKAVF